MIDARVPVEVFSDGHLIAQLVQPAELHLKRDPGRVSLTLLVSGNANDISVDVPEQGSALVLVGRTGITASTIRPDAASAEPMASGSGEFRVAGDQGLTLVMDGTRHKLTPGGVLSLDLPTGEHALSLRSAEGTVVWANGKLLVAGGPFVVQLSAGRMPEISGDGASFLPDGS